MAFKIREVEILVECFCCVPSSEFPYSLISFLSFHCFVCKAFISHQIRSDLEKKIGNSQVGISSEVLEGRKLHLIYHSVPFITEGKLFNTQCVSGTIWSREEPMARQPHNSQEDTVKTGLIWNHWGIWLTCKCPDATHREATAPHSSALAWRIPGTGEPGGLQSMGSHRVGRDWSDLAAAAADTTQDLLNQHPCWMSWESHHINLCGLETVSCCSFYYQCFWTVMLEKTLQSPLGSNEIKPVHPKGNQPWLFIGRTDAEAEIPILWPPDAKNRLLGKDPDAGKDWGEEEKSGDGGWDGWMASLTQWTWVWANSGR